jgi:hypothetical protein
MRALERERQAREREGKGTWSRMSSVRSAQWVTQSPMKARRRRTAAASFDTVALATAALLRSPPPSAVPGAGAGADADAATGLVGPAARDAQLDFFTGAGCRTAM